ncbi:hypothetical protein RUM44_012539 [Polyplax serrata]|uniref:Uncharacterized protein n=1 Tax=Polyplax serrata TaxID=468196 RepID=A0ABR1BBL7_POLSC
MRDSLCVRAQTLTQLTWAPLSVHLTHTAQDTVSVCVSSGVGSHEWFMSPEPAVGGSTSADFESGGCETKV